MPLSWQSRCRTYTSSEIGSYSCVSCNDAPAVPSPADACSGAINNA